MRGKHHIGDERNLVSYFTVMRIDIFQDQGLANDLDHYSKFLLEFSYKCIPPRFTKFQPAAKGPYPLDRSVISINFTGQQ